MKSASRQAASVVFSVCRSVCCFQSDKSDLSVIVFSEINVVNFRTPLNFSKSKKRPMRDAELSNGWFLHVSPTEAVRPGRA